MPVGPPADPYGFGAMSPVDGPSLSPVGSISHALISDGLSNTIGVVERGAPHQHWVKGSKVAEVNPSAPSSSAVWAGKWYPDERLDSGPVSELKTLALRTAWESFREAKTHRLKAAFEDYRTREASWLVDYSLFMAIRESYYDVAFTEWPKELVVRDPAAIAKATATLRDLIDCHQFGQFLFDRQWTQLKEYAHSKKIQIIGDIPIFVSADSADVWANPKLFLLDARSEPTVVAGVPPDYFSQDGQHWGNPIYDWKAMQADGYAWWVARIRQTLKQVDLIRLDHFRRFVQAWHIPAGEKTARNG